MLYHPVPGKGEPERHAGKADHQCTGIGRLIYSPDISKHLEYLEAGGYIEFTDRRANAYNVYRKDGVVKLTKKGVDLVEGTIEEPGVDV